VIRAAWHNDQAIDPSCAESTQQRPLPRRICRPQAISDPLAYRVRLSRILRRTDVVKASVEDLGYLYPGEPVPSAVATILGQGPKLVLVTDGPRPARAFLPGRKMSADVPLVQVVDTIGAGDAFGGAFLAWWSRNGLARSDIHRPDAVAEALQAATGVAVLTCTRAGAEPPWLAEVAGRPGWRPEPWTKRELSLP
jgi:fructokinase